MPNRPLKRGASGAGSDSCTSERKVVVRVGRKVPSEVIAGYGRDRSVAGAHVMLAGGAPLDGPRHVWWNFVSSRRDRIQQAKEDWRAGRFALPPDDRDEFIPLPVATPKTVSYP